MAEIKEMLRTGMMWILNPPEFLLLQVFQHEIDATAGLVITDTAGDASDDGRAWHRAAVATRAILRDHGEDVKTEWLAAFAELPPMPFTSEAR